MSTRHAKARWSAVVEKLEGRTLFATTSVPGFVDEQVVTGLSKPTAMDFAPDGRLFVNQQGGAMRVIKNGSLLATPFLTLNVDSSGERGLLGIAFDPNFATNRFLYAYYTVPAPAGGSAHNRVSRFTASAANPDVVQSGSELPILDLDNLSGATNHNGGAIHFGIDGKLYVAVGENANGANSQTLSNRLGKVLRINPDGTIPTDNPFYNTASGVNRAIWAMGLRNPFTFAVQPGTGTMYINDVGESTWEEINVGVAGANYGWNTIEGVRTTQTPPANYQDPLLAYRHPQTGSDPNTVGYAITGGAFYNPAGAAQYPVSYQGDYFYADTGGNNGGHWIRKLEAGTNTSSLFATDIIAAVDLKVGPDGKLYYVERGNGGRVGRIAAQAPAVSNVKVNDGSVQRSQVTSVTVTFSRSVRLDAGAITLAGQNGAGEGVTVAVSPSDNTAATSFVVTFGGTGVGADGSLPDGVYDLKVAADKVHDASVAAMTLPAGFTTTVRRLLADADGDGSVGPGDFNLLASHFGQTGQTPGTGDFNGDGLVGPEDFNLLASRFGTTLVQSPTATVLAAEPASTSAPSSSSSSSSSSTPSRHGARHRTAAVAPADTPIAVRPAKARRANRS